MIIGGRNELPEFTEDIIDLMPDLECNTHGDVIKQMVEDCIKNRSHPEV